MPPLAMSRALVGRPPAVRTVMLLSMSSTVKLKIFSCPTFTINVFLPVMFGGKLSMRTNNVNALGGKHSYLIVIENYD